MTTRIDSMQTLPFPPQRVIRCVAVLLLATSVATAGCKWLGGGSGGGNSDSPRSNGDPLLGNRIPPQDVPVPERGGYARDRKDPLLTSPAGRDKGKSGDRAGSKGDSNDVSALPPRASGKEPYRPTLETTPAALAGGLIPDKELSMDRRPPTPATGGTGPVPLTASIPGSTKPSGFGDGFDVATKYLKATGAKWDGPFKEGEQYVVRVSVPISQDQPAPVRRYEGMGATPAAAIQQAVEQIRTDRAK